MKGIKNKVAAVTGAASGIGRMLCVNLARQGCRIAMADINEHGLEETAKMLGPINGSSVSTHIVDVGNRDQVYDFAAQTESIHGGADIIINNAGVVVTDSLEDVSYEDFNWLFDIDFWGVVYGSKAFLPLLKKRHEGHIVNISSVNGFVPFPNNGPYCAAKFAVKAFSETLVQELRNTGIHVTCVHPGGIKTDIVRNARFRKAAAPNLDYQKAVSMFDRLTITSADRAAKKIISAVLKNKTRLLIGPDAVVFDILTRMFPAWFVRFLGWASSRPLPKAS